MDFRNMVIAFGTLHLGRWEVFMLWGNYAIAKADLIDVKKHTILKAAHPSPFSANRGFFGCKHFSTTNKILQEKGLQPIDWDLNE